MMRVLPTRRLVSEHRPARGGRRGGRIMAVQSKQAVEILDTIAKTGQEPANVIKRLKALSVETPSWGYADTGTRFGKFAQAAAARTIEEKLDDAAQVHKLTGICQSV